MLLLIVLPFEGEDRLGAAGADMTIVKLQVDDHDPVPQALIPRTRQ